MTIGVISLVLWSLVVLGLVYDNHRLRARITASIEGEEGHLCTCAVGCSEVWLRIAVPAGDLYRLDLASLASLARMHRGLAPERPVDIMHTVDGLVIEAAHIDSINEYGVWAP